MKNKNIGEERQCTYNVIMRSVSADIGVGEKKQVLHILSV